MASTPLTPQEKLAKSKLRALAQGIRVWTLEPGYRYAIPSSANDGTAYEVHIHGTNPEDISCNCPGGINHGSCKHAGAVILRLEAEQELFKGKSLYS